MNIKEYATDFTVFVLSQDAELGSSVKLALSQSRYDAYFFADYDEMTERLRLAPPHVVIVDQNALLTDLAGFFEKVLTLAFAQWLLLL